MNGIIHNVSHPQDDSASYRIAEEQIFLGVFAYISHLFSVIKPQKLFFLAIDGVAPRAKMNQQRSRRFRTAKEMKEVVDKAKAKGEIIPDGDGFDSNCITPGTPFMARLSAQLKYFIAKKVSEDSDWRGVEIILSGHEVHFVFSPLRAIINTKSNSGAGGRRAQDYGIHSIIESSTWIRRQR